MRDEQQRPPRLVGGCREPSGDCEERDGAGSIIVGAVVYGVAAYATVCARETVAKKCDSHRLVRGGRAQRVLHALTPNDHVVGEHGVVIERAPLDSDVIAVRADGAVRVPDSWVAPSCDADDVARGI